MLEACILKGCGMPGRNKLGLLLALIVVLAMVAWTLLPVGRYESEASFRTLQVDIKPHERVQVGADDR
jgi:hypothetical protein